MLVAALALRNDDDSTNDAHAAAMCRALYDVNKMEGGFCCQSLAFKFAEGPDGVYGEQFMTTATKTSALEPFDFEMEYGDEGPAAGTTIKISLKSGAEVFKSAKGLATSVVTIAMALAYY